MPIQFPINAEEVINRAKSDVKLALPNSDPFSNRESFLCALVAAYGNRIFDTNFTLKQLLLELFPDTATGEFLERWGSIVDINRNAASGSSGNIFFTGTATSVIPVSTELTSTDSNTYQTTSEGTISSESISVTSLTRVGSTATAVTSSDHGLSNTVSITISGAVETDYNGTFSITVVSATSFTYTVSGSPSTPATGTILAGFTGVNVPVQSTTFGASTNKVLGSSLTLVSPISGVDNTALVDFNELGGGTDTESDADYRDRVLFRYQNPVANFNVAAITNQAKSIAGVTRVFVFPTTPAIGQVEIYFVRDDDSNIIPTAQELQDVKDALVIPATTDDSDVFVLAPTAVSTNFTFSSITPNTTTMMTAITNNLQQLFSNTSVGVDVKEVEYTCAIAGTIDTVSGDKLTAFTLTSPSGDITIAAGELATLGAVTF